MNKNFQEGKKENGKYFLRVGKTWVEVEARVYYGYMDLVWSENKNNDRRSRCVFGGKRCKGNCEECEYERSGGVVSLDQLREETEFEPEDPSPSVEDQVLKRFLIGALRRELKKLPLEDQLLLHDIYFEDVPYTTREIGRKLGISHQRVSQRHQELLVELRIKLENEICD